MALIDDLISYYKLDETSGTTATDSHGSNNGTANNSRVFTTEATGIINTSADFTGGSDYIQVSDSSSLDIIGAYSIQTWVKASNFVGATVLEKGASATNYAHYGIVLSGDVVTFYSGSGGNTFLQSTTTLSADTWYHIVVVVEGTGTNKAKIYINGSLDTQGTLGFPTANALNLGIGTWRVTDSPSNFLNGVMDEVGIWSRALSSTEVTALYNSGDGFAYPFIIPVPPPPTPEGTIGTRDISKDYPIESERTWETIQDLVPEEADLTPQRMRVGLN